jgi:hypothetical protein
MLLASNEIGTSLAPRDGEASFGRGYYSPTMNLDHFEWQVMYRQFVESTLVAKQEPTSD